MTRSELLRLPQTYIEGTDCSGKDELASRLAAVTGDRPTRHLVVDKENPFEKILNKEKEEDKFFVGILIARAIMHDIEFAKGNRFPSDSNIQVSLHALRAVAYETARGGDLTGVFQELLKYFPLFDLTILLTASLECKRERLTKRSQTTGQASEFDNLMFTKPDFVQKMDEVIRRHATEDFGAVVFDTDDMSLDDVSENAISILENGFTEKTGIIKPSPGRSKVSQFNDLEKRYINSELERYKNFIKKRLGKE